MLVFMVYFFFFKQRTAYELRISDWSSDVCSSDLDPARPDLLLAANAAHAEVFVLTTDDSAANLRTARIVKRHFPHLRIIARARNRQHAFRLMDLDEIGRESCRERVCQYV